MIWCAPIVAMLLAQAPGARTGPREYVPIRLPDNAEALLQEFLKGANDPFTAAIRDMVLKEAEKLRHTPPDKLQQMLDMHLKNPALQDPAIAKLLDQFLDVQKGQPGGEGQGPDALKDFNERLLKDEQFSEAIAKRLADKLPPDSVPRPPEPEVRVNPRPPEGAMPPRGDGNPDATLEDRFTRWLADWIQEEATEGHLADLLRDAPDLQAALGDLTKSLRGAMGEGGWTPKMPAWGPPLGLNLRPPQLPFRLGELPRISLPQMPELPQVNLPLPRPRLGISRLPSLGGGPRMPSFSGSGGSSTWLYLGLALVGMVAAAWLLSRLRWSTPSDERSALGALVVPDSVRSRSELRQLFDALALTRLGLQARSWNHELVARRWSEAPDQSAAARDLAELYELARYTPGDEVLSPEQQRQVVRILGRLQGATA